MSVNFFLRSLLVALLVTASASAVTTVWNGTASSDWDTLGNWTSTLPAVGDTVTLNAVTTPAVYPVLSTMVAGGSYLANVTVNSGAELTLNSGATLYTSALPINSTGAVGGTVNVNAGALLYRSANASDYWTAGTVNIRGTMYFNRAVYIASGGTLAVPRVMTVNVLDGGIWNIGNQNTFQLGGSGTIYSQGIVNVWGNNGSGTGSLLSFGNNNPSIPRSGSTTSYISVKNGGRIEYNTGMDSIFVTAMNNNYIRSADAREILTKALVPGSTTRYRITTYVNDRAYNPIPASPSNLPAAMTLVTLGSVPVSFTAPLARDYSDTVECRVYNNFATGTYPTDVNGLPTDPNGDLLTSYTTITRPAATSMTMTSAVGGFYQWRVDCIDHSKDGIDPNYPITTKGPVWYFRTGNSAPVANAGTAQTLGLVGGTATLTTNATITNDGLPVGGAVTGQWTFVDGPTTPAGLPANVTQASPNMTLSLTQTGRYRFQLIPYDTALYGTASILSVSVYSDTCVAAKAGTWTALAGDFNADCVVNGKDLALMVADWLRCSNEISGCN